MTSQLEKSTPDVEEIDLTDVGENTGTKKNFI